jgi:O-antigen/teichoic acid export membrane protein
MTTGSSSYTAQSRHTRPHVATEANIRGSTAMLLGQVIALLVSFVVQVVVVRQLTKDDYDVRELYWQTASWIAVVTFPILAMTTAFAQPFTVFTLGERYASSGAVLAILAIGYYVNAALGFNGLTVQILGRRRWVLITNITTIVVMVVAATILVAHFDAVGAAVAVLITLIVHNVLKQAGLGFGAKIGLWQRKNAWISMHIVAMVVVLYTATLVFDVPIWAACVVVLTLWLALLRRTRHVLRVAETYPELAKLPLLRSLLR